MNLFILPIIAFLNLNNSGYLLTFPCPVENGKVIETKPTLYHAQDPKYGIRIEVDYESIVRAIDDGSVVRIIPLNDRFVILTSNDRISLSYRYVSETKVKEGDRIVAGQILGKVDPIGPTQQLTLSMRVKGRKVDPRKYVNCSNEN